PATRASRRRLRFPYPRHDREHRGNLCRRPSVQWASLILGLSEGRRTRRRERCRRWNRRSAGWDCEELHVGDRDAQVPGDSTAPCRARGRERRRCCWHYALPSGTVALPFSLRILTPSVTGSEGETEIRCNVGA